MRQKNSILNIITGIGSQVILLFLGFFTRKIFINEMGLQLLGINGLFSSIISMLSLVELGIGGAIYYGLYKPLSQNNLTQVRAIMQLYSKMYKYIALAVALIGVAIFPLLGVIVKEKVNALNLNVVFLIFLLDAVISYLLAYHKNIITADQKSYVINTLQTIFSIIMQLLQIVVILITHNFILYLIIKIAFGFLSNLIFYYLSIKIYPYLKEKSKVVLDSEIKAEIIKNTKALFIVQLSVYFVYGTDNLLISSFVSVTAVGIYSNYLLIINTITGLVGQFFSGLRASFGNFLVKESKEDAQKIFNILFFVNFWLSGFCSTCLVVLFNPFISLWLGGESLLSLEIVVIIVINFYCRSMTQAVETVRNGAGLYSPYPFFKYWALLEGILNIILGLIFAGLFKFGIFGILIATVISTQITVFALPWNVYKYVFQRSSNEYYKKYFMYTVLMIFFISVTYALSNFVDVRNEYINFILKSLICLVVPNAFIIGIFNKTDEFVYIRNIGVKFIRNKDI